MAYLGCWPTRGLIGRPTFDTAALVSRVRRAVTATAPIGPTEPTLTDVYAAAKRLHHFLMPTPLRISPGISRLVGTEVYLKHEHHLPTGAFKVRGGINLVSKLDAPTHTSGIATASTGNHGQSIAYAASLFGVPATIYAPVDANPVKVEAMKELGADVVLTGRDFDESRLACEAMSAKAGMRYIHAGNEPDLIAGVGTHTLEIISELPDVDVIIVPIGGGSGASGACIAAKGINPAIRVIGVQSAQAPAAHLSWSQGRAVEYKSATWADGLATGTPFALPQRILRNMLDDFVLVSDEQLYASVRLLLERARIVVEGAAAACLAAALTLEPQLSNQKTVLILTGGNISPSQLSRALEHTSNA